MVSEFGPWIFARWDSDCDGCGNFIEAEDRIRSDGEGGWLCEDCGLEDPEDDL